MTTSDPPADLLRVAKRMVWFKTPEETLAEPFLFLSYAMTYGTVDDLRVARAHFTDEQLRQALRARIPGVFDARSWAYWHAVLGIRPAPPLPTRNLPDTTTSRQEEVGTRFKVRPHAFNFKPGVDVDRLNQLADELETAEIVEKLRR